MGRRDNTSSFLLPPSCFLSFDLKLSPFCTQSEFHHVYGRPEIEAESERPAASHSPGTYDRVCPVQRKQGLGGSQSDSLMVCPSLSPFIFTHLTSYILHLASSAPFHPLPSHHTQRVCANGTSRRAQADYVKWHEGIRGDYRGAVAPGTAHTLMSRAGSADARLQQQLLFDVDYAYAEFFRSLSGGSKDGAS